MKRLIFVAGLAIGFVVGSRMGRGPYESLERTARQVADDPQVQKRAAQAREAASRVAHDAAETVKDKAPDVAAGVQEKVTGAAGAAKEKLGGSAKGKSDSGETSRTSSPSSNGSSTGSDASAAGGDAEVGDDKPLTS